MGDPFIEHEAILLSLNVLIHKPSAFAHLILNRQFSLLPPGQRNLPSLLVLALLSHILPLYRFVSAPYSTLSPSGDIAAPPFSVVRRQLTAVAILSVTQLFVSYYVLAVLWGAFKHAVRHSKQPLASVSFFSFFLLHSLPASFLSPPTVLQHMLSPSPFSFSFLIAQVGRLLGLLVLTWDASLLILSLSALFSLSLQRLGLTILLQQLVGEEHRMHRYIATVFVTLSFLSGFYSTTLMSYVFQL